ncbi:LAGLIDADG family homing endonuclease [Paenibacillus sp. LHD-117]|uniref:LAGLIDADG family homing endonuclease n=1 Tax=Paenibacillus sp. LHD-117 TaxID=3071412 RepID=UPI0027DF2265|nr:LAGLIDADG family homing endonuclease [Paenibacillus sp. LHD-117]MDQ6419015.1 LAGLIDADG family homing endonuclease [Paenibacillus sp. LHD-117]
MRLEGLSEKIFLDRYARKHPDGRACKVGDTVLVLVKDDPKFPAKEVGEVVGRDREAVRVKLRGSGEIAMTTVDKLVLPVERTPEEMWDRLAESIASAETLPAKRVEWERRFRAMLDDWKLVPGGRIMAGAGASDELTLFNCYVVPSPKDSRGGIMKTLSDMTEIMARGGGVGMNLSTLRPRRAIVAGVNGSSSGAVSWGGLFSYTTGLIEQGGSRRGALMIMLNDWHPDLMEFITVKQSMSEVTNANLSVCVSDAFMDAVKRDADWELVFPDTKEVGYDELWGGDLEKWRGLGKRVVTYRKLPAREIWHAIIESAWRSAEPGVVFMERYNKLSNSWYFNPITSTNPCFHPDTRITSEFGLIKISELYQLTKGTSFDLITDNRIMEQAKVVNGRSYPSTGTSIREGIAIFSGSKKTIKVGLKNGMELQVTPNHRFYTTAGWKEAKDLERNDEVCIQSGEGLFAESDDLGETWGMFLGWLIGDGWLSKRGDVGMVFGEDDSEIIPKMIEAGKRLSGAEAKLYERQNGTFQLFWWRKAFREKLISLGVKAVNAPFKTVPECIFRSSKQTVTPFLQALFSSDGTVYENDEMHRTVRLTSASKALLQDVQLLLLNYGIHAPIYLRVKRNQTKFSYTTIEGVEREYKSSPFYELILSGNNIVVFNNEIGFKFIRRKQEALERISRPSRKNEKFKSKVIELTESEEESLVYDIHEPVSNSLIANGMVVHNCGEQGLPGWGVCNLSAVNLSRFYDAQRNDVDWEELGKVTRWAVRFLDNVIDKTPYHFEENERNQKRERRIGLGTMGLAELMIKLGIRYGGEESVGFLDRLFGFMAKEAYLSSAQLAAEKGAFPAFETEPYLQSGFMKELTAAYPEVGEAIRRQGMRNVTVLTQAPTGSTGTMVGTSTGIEPYFAFDYYRQSRLGYDKQLVPIAQEWLDANPGQALPDYYVTAMELSAENHIRTQAAIQRWVDSSISKTANCPADFTVEETKRLYELAYELGCKGVTIYRDGSRDVQVLSAGVPEKKVEDRGGSSILEENAEEADSAIVGASADQPISLTVDKQYKRRPQVLRGATYKINTPFGMAYITINDLNGSPAEIFLNVGKAGSDVFAMAEALGRVCSLFLRYGDHGNKVRLLVKHLKGIGGTGAIGFGVHRVESIADAVAKALELHGVEDEANLASQQVVVERAYEALKEVAEHSDREHESEAHADLCPSCGSAALVNLEGCKQCRICGFSKCN